MSYLPAQWFFAACGWLSLGMGIAGVFLPVLPTTPFVLLAAFCFSKSSKKLHTWLYHHPRFGVMIQHWQKHGAIKAQAKVMATFLIVLSFSGSILFTSLPLVLKELLGAAGIGVLLFIWTRPLPPAESPSGPDMHAPGS